MVSIRIEKIRNQPIRRCSPFERINRTENFVLTLYWPHQQILSKEIQWSDMLIPHGVAPEITKKQHYTNH